MPPTIGACAPLLSALLLTNGPGAPSPAAAALRRGDLVTALASRAADPGEAVYIQARVALAGGDLRGAEQAAERLPAGGRRAARIAWYLAHARGDGEAIGRTAAQLCKLGDPTGRACADAELYASPVPAPSVAIAGPTEVPLSKNAPVPVALARADEVKTGVVLDTGASETVLSSALARRLGLLVTRSSFPIGVAGGGKRATARLAVLPALEIGGATVRSLPVLVVDLPDLARVGVEAIVSPQQAFAGATAELDLGRRRLRLSPGSVAGARRDGFRAITVPYRIAGFDLAVEASVGRGPRALFGLDTGMQGSFAVTEGYAAEGVFPLPVSLVRGAGGEAELPALPPLPVELGGTTLSGGRGVLAPSSPAEMGLAGLLGDGLWEGGVVVLDNAARRITILLPNATEEAPVRIPNGRSPAF